MDNALALWHDIDKYYATNILVNRDAFNTFTKARSRIHSYYS